MHPRRNLRRASVWTKGGKGGGKKADKKKRMQRRNIRLLPLGIEVGRRFAFYGDVLCKRVREEVWWLGYRGGRRGRRLAILGDSVDTMGSQYITSPNPTPLPPPSLSLCLSRSLSLSLYLSVSLLRLFHLSGFPSLVPTSSVAVVSTEQHQRGSQMP